MPYRAFRGITNFLHSTSNDLSQAEIARILHIRQPQVSLYQKDAPTRISWWQKLAQHIFELGYKRGQVDATTRFLGAVVDAFGEIPQSDLAKALGVSQPAISTWLRGASVPTRKNLERLLDLHVSRLAEPLVEFHAISPTRSGKSWKLHHEKGKEVDLRRHLGGRAGLYVFYDSAGNVTYLGKTESDLWTEAKQRLCATLNRQFYSPNRRSGIQQGHVARYLSAYEVRVPAAIHNLEVLMLRSFANDLANTNIGNFKTGL